MTKPKIIIRVDGNSNIGLGHIYRGIALAEMLKNDFDVSFVTRQDSTISPVDEAGFSYAFLPLIPYLGEPEWFKENIDNNAIIICDGYEFKTEYQKKIKKQGFKLVYIDDLVKHYMYADLVINHAPDIKKEHYKAEDYTKFALGPKYAILRPAFLKAAKQNRTIDKIDTAFVSFGGADVNNFTFKFVELLLNIPEIKRVNIVLGVANKNSKHLKFVNTQNKLTIYQDVTGQKMVEIIQKSQIAIVPSSTVLFEVCTVNIPVISGYYINNQKRIYNGFLNDNLIVGVGDIQKLDRNNLAKKINSLIKDKGRIKELIVNQAAVFDNLIKERITNQIKSLCLN